MKNIKLSVKEHNLTDQYLPMFKRYDYIETYDFENDDDIEMLYEKVNLFVHTYYTYQKNIRSESRFESATAIFLDFDTKNEHTDSDIEEFLDSEFAEKYNWILYTSKSHIVDEQECFHVILPLNQEITDVLTLRSTYNGVFDELRSHGLRCDFKVRDGARLVFPSMNMSVCEDKHFDNFVFDCHRDGIYLETVHPTIEEIQEDIGALYDDDDETVCDGDVEHIDGIYLQAFKEMSSSSQYRYIECIMKYMNRVNRRNKFKSIAYNQWVSLGFSLNKIFGTTKGLKLFTTLSAGHPKDNTKSLERQFKYLDSQTYSDDEVVLMIIKQSAKMKFSHMMYFKYYYMAKQIFTPTQTQLYFNRMINLMLDDRGYDLVNHNNVKIYKYTSKRKSRTYMMEISLDGYRHPIKVSMGEMKKIMAHIFNIPVEFVTISITDGIIRKSINKNGIYDITGMIRESVLRKIEDIDLNKNGYVPVSEIKCVVSEIRENSPSTISHLTNTKSVEQYLMENGIITDKKSQRFVIDGSKKQCTAYKIDKSKITLPIT